MSSPLRERIGMRSRQNSDLAEMRDRSAMARALMYLLAAVGTAVVASVVIPDAPLADETALPALAGVAYAAAIGVLFGFERLPAWCVHALLLAVTALIGWAVYASDEPGSPYVIFFVWVAIYAAFFFGPLGAAIQVAGMLGGYGAALIAIGDSDSTAALHWALAASALVLVVLAIQALTTRIARLLERLTEIGRADSVTGLYNAAAFTEMLDNEIERARRSGNRLSLVIAELDGLAAVSSGPLPPSQRDLLAKVAEILRATTRQIDMAARLGGSRFGLLLPYTDEHGGYLLAERLRERLAALDGGHMSMGVAGFPRMGATAQVIFQAAESALEEAREAGGDRVMMYQRSHSSARVEIGVPDVHEEQFN